MVSNERGRAWGEKMTGRNSRIVVSFVRSGRTLRAEYDRDVPAADNETLPSR